MIDTYSDDKCTNGKRASNELRQSEDPSLGEQLVPCATITKHATYIITDYHGDSNDGGDDDVISPEE